MSNNMDKKGTDFFKSLLNDLKFDELESELRLKPFAEMEDILYQIAYNPDTGESNLLVYTFMQKLISKTETWQIHISISRLMGSILNFIDKAELIGLYHGWRALELNPNNAEIMEYLLYYNHIPEKLLKDNDAIKLAEKVILKKPESLAALMTLSKKA